MMLDVLATIWKSFTTAIHRPHISESPVEMGKSCFPNPCFSSSLFVGWRACEKDVNLDLANGKATDISRDGTLTEVGIRL